MQRYIIIRMYRAEKMLEDWHDINLDDCKTHSAALQKWANAQGAVCFLHDSEHDLAVSGAFAEIEYNFDLSPVQKNELTEMIKPFFIDGEVSGKGSKLHIETACTLKAVRFLRTDGELIGIE